MAITGKLQFSDVTVLMGDNSFAKILLQSSEIFMTFGWREKTTGLIPGKVDQVSLPIINSLVIMVLSWKDILVDRFSFESELNDITRTRSV